MIRIGRRFIVITLKIISHLGWEILAVSFLLSDVAYGFHKGKYRNPNEKPIAPISKSAGPYSHSK